MNATLGKKRLFINTIFLYVLTFSNQLLGLITVPYLTRILGPSVYGKLGMALSLMAYVQLTLDFGFILSATELISKNRDNKEYCGKIFTSVLVIKTILMLIIAIIFFSLCMLIESWRTDIKLFFIFFLAYCINSYLPDYFYRGMERMQIITIRTVFVKFVFTLFIFLLIKKESDLIFYPIILSIGNLIAVLWSLKNVINEYGIRLSFPSKSFIKKIFIKTFPFFISRIASTFYQVATTIILGTIYVNQPVVGYYSAADKIMSVTKSCSSPVADSLYPYMTRTKDFNLVKKILFITVPLIIIIGLVTFVYAKEICVLLFGVEYENTANILRCMIPAMMVIFPTYIICFPVLTPLGLSRYANLSNVIGAVLQIILLIILFLVKQINVYTICICGSICEVVVFLFRLFIAISYKKFKHRNYIKGACV